MTRALALAAAIALAGCGAGAPSAAGSSAADAGSIVEPLVLFVPGPDAGTTGPFELVDAAGKPAGNLTAAASLSDDDEAVRFTVDGQVFDVRAPVLSSRLLVFV